MKPEYLKPDEIEKRSFEIIRSELTNALDPVLEPVIMRVIHTSADFEYADSLIFSEGVINQAVMGLQQGTHIVSDTNMVRAGVDKARLSALGSEIHCFMSDEDVAYLSRQKGITRAMAAMDKASALNKPLIFAIGNAPTALLRICELKEAGICEPKLVIGVPVGFVNTIESKEMLIQSGIPYIVSQGRKGGSSIAASICNALLRIALA